MMMKSNSQLSVGRDRKLRTNFFILGLSIFMAILVIENFGVSVNAANFPSLLDNHHLGHISSNILFTAPHSKQVYRGG